MNIKILVLTLKLLVIVFAEKSSYKGHKVYKITPKNDAAVNCLEDIRRSGLGEFWDDYFAVDLDVRINLVPNNTNEFLKILEPYSIEYKEIIADIQSLIDKQLTPSAARSVSYLSYSWNEYHDLDRLYAWLDELQEHNNAVTTVIKGYSVLGLPIKGIVINYNPDRTEKLIGMLEGTLHAREWISTATITWIIKEFLTSNNPVVRRLAETFEWHIFPVVNPDGYVYTFTTHRMWRKNRSPTNLTTCPGSHDDMSHGVDLNRNFDFNFNLTGTSPDPCSNLFPGPYAFSEPEARAIRDYVLSATENGTIIYYLGFHSYGQLIIVPYSHVIEEDTLESVNYADMFEVSIRAADALKQRYGTEYRVGLSASVMYPMSGSSFDWVKRETKVPIALLLELRDRGSYGFLLPPELILPTAMETMDALIEMDKVTRELGYYQYRASAASVMSSFLIVTLSVFLVFYC